MTETAADRPPEVAVIARQLDTSTEIMLERYAGLTDEEYLWEPGPGAWSLRPTDRVRTGRSHGRGPMRVEFESPPPEPAPLRTIAWLMWHISECCLLRADYTIGTRSLTPDDVATPDTAEAALAQLRHALGRWRAVFDEVPAQDYALVGRSSFPWGLDPSLPLTEILWWQTREVLHHGAEIALLRDLYAWRQAPDH